MIKEKMISKVLAKKFEKGTESTCSTEKLVIEAPLQIIVNYVPYIITMRTPTADEAFVRGLIFSEQIIAYEDSNYPIKITQREKEIALSIKIKISPNKIKKAINDNRSLISSASCGICGKKDFKDLEIKFNKLNTFVEFSFEEILRMFQRMEAEQILFKETGASHAASIFNKKSKLISVHEDIGRHNAVDKVIGEALMMKKLHKISILLVSGRISCEIVLKALTVGVPSLASVSAPSSLAVEIAKKHGLSIYAFCRKNRVTKYC